MQSDIAIDKLIEDARRAGKHRTGKDAVETALHEYLHRHRQQRIGKDFGTVDFDPAYDYKVERRRERI